jgi:hypothetical protein
MPDDYTHQRENAGTEWVNLSVNWVFSACAVVSLLLWQYTVCKES